MLLFFFYQQQLGFLKKLYIENVHLETSFPSIANKEFQMVNTLYVFLNLLILVSLKRQIIT